MGLRTRLFIWVGTLFLIASLASYFLEQRVTKTNLYKAEAHIKGEIEQLNEDTRRYIEVFLRNALAEQEAEINVLLDKIAENATLVQGFQPTTYNLQHQTWLSSALVSVVNKWVDFIQNTNEGQLGSLIAINADKVELAMRFPVNDNVALVAVKKKDKEQFEGPYVGIRLQYNRFLLDEDVESATQADQIRSRYALFSMDQILKLDLGNANIANLQKRLGGNLAFSFLISQEAAEQYIEEFTSNMKFAQNYLQTHSRDLPPPTDPSALNAWVQAHLQSQGQINAPTERSLELERERKLYGQPINKDISQQILRLLDRYDQIDMIWGLSTLTATGIFGFSPFDALAPIGCSRFTNIESAGKAIYSHEVFVNQPLFHEPACDSDIFPTNMNVCLNPQMEVIDLDQMRRTFFSNSMEFKSGSGQNQRIGFLTLGVDAARILRQLSMATHEIAVLVSNGRVVSVYNADGVENTTELWQRLPIENMMPKKSGTLEVGGKDYYFLHMTPFEEMDFHFFIFNPKDIEFALVDTLEQNASDLIDHISMQMRIASVIGLALVLIFLSNIAKRITKPIVKLAEAAELVCQGKFEDAHLPELKTNRKDEVCTLYRTFCKMVGDLRDKEKVRGVLNKVVSPEIADEILKGNVHLGGEERTVTVLFADIRHFTSLTEKMPPGEVIELLNTCMTKISHAIDQFGGVIDKYVGDEVMALFGAPVAKEDSSLKAVQSGLAIIDTLNEWNIERKTAGKPTIEMGIGIHTGIVLAGNMGAENRLNYTVLGSNVNLSSRLCSAAHPMQILISSDTLKSPMVADTVKTEQVTDVSLKGFSRSIDVFAVKGYQHPSVKP